MNLRDSSRNCLYTKLWVYLPCLFSFREVVYDLVKYFKQLEKKFVNHVLQKRHLWMVMVQKNSIVVSFFFIYISMHLNIFLWIDCKWLKSEIVTVLAHHIRTQKKNSRGNLGFSISLKDCRSQEWTLIFRLRENDHKPLKKRDLKCSHSKILKKRKKSEKRNKRSIRWKCQDIKDFHANGCLFCTLQAEKNRKKHSPLIPMGGNLLLHLQQEKQSAKCSNKLRNTNKNQKCWNWYYAHQSKLSQE